MERKPDQVVLKLTSPGGLVHTYGLASSQLSRLRDAGIPLCACVDTVAASGGYMMAVCADRIVSAPFRRLGIDRCGRADPKYSPLFKEPRRRY